MLKTKRCAAVLVCAGSGNRMGDSCKDKLMLELCGRPVVSYTIEAYAKASHIDYIVLVTRGDLIDQYQSLLAEYADGVDFKVVEGGSERAESVINGVRAVPEKYSYVAIADGARPLIRCQEIDKTIEVAFKCGAAALGAVMTDTVKKIKNGKIIQTIPRDDLVTIQTPQVFEREEYMICAMAASKLNASFTDDASIFEKFGKEVAFVEGRRDNLKITVPEDIAILQALMEERK